MNARQSESASWAGTERDVPQTRHSTSVGSGTFDLALQAVQLDRDIEARSTLLRAEAKRFARQAKTEAAEAARVAVGERRRVPSLRVGRLWIGWQAK